MPFKGSAMRVRINSGYRDKHNLNRVIKLELIFFSNLCVSSPVSLNAKIDLFFKIKSLLTFRLKIRPIYRFEFKKVFKKFKSDFKDKHYFITKK